MRFRVVVPLAAAAALALAGSVSARPAGPPGYAFGTSGQSPKLGVRAGQVPPGFTGGPTTASNGETVSVYVEDPLVAADPGAGRRWADFLAGLLHGPELSTATLYVASLDRVRQICGAGALGCYSRGQIVALGEDVGDVRAASIVAHEYGHHVANSRNNDPWQAVDWGTKRWATYLNVCSRSLSGQLFPGDESSNYRLNPGEVFAEDYRVLSERRGGLPESPWQVVDQSLYPDQTALDLLAQDVTEPWTDGTFTTYRVKIGPGASGRGFRFPTPLDGRLVATLTVPAKAKLVLRLVDLTTGKVLAVGSPALRVQSVPISVCGQRAIQVQVKRVSGAGTFTLAVARP
ncbi:MAG TPA: hypothetical protein VFA66_03110 [Gaiellaceae bacterium]|nr:hypothetical protein [Gaiellaceae bacterium]